MASSSLRAPTPRFFERSAIETIADADGRALARLMSLAYGQSHSEVSSSISLARFQQCTRIRHSVHFSYVTLLFKAVGRGRRAASISPGRATMGISVVASTRIACVVVCGMI
jgi:hypothetical protein